MSNNNQENEAKVDSLTLDARGNYCLTSEKDKINTRYEKEVEDAKKVSEANKKKSK